MALPESIQRNADQADELEKQIMNGGDAPSAPDQPSEAQPAQDTAVAEEQQHTDASSETESKWEAKYKTLQGMYNSDGARFKSEKEALERQLAEYADQLRQLRESIASEEEQKQYITEEDTTLFGSDLVDFTQRAAKQEAAKYSREAAQLRNEVDQLKAELGGVRTAAAESAKMNYLQRLTELVPDWKAQNTDQGFLDWLNQSDPFAPGTRKEVLDAAYNNLDARRTADIFLAYRGITGGAAPQVSKAEQSLRKQVAPDTRSGATTAPGGEKRYFTQDEIRDFYEGVRRNQYTSEQAAAIEHEIDMAVAEGRVR